MFTNIGLTRENASFTATVMNCKVKYYYLLPDINKFDLI